MRNLADRTILVTGATDGLGKRVALELAGRGATVLLHGRDEGRTEATLGEIRGQTGNEKSRYYLADFSSLEEVHAMVARILSDHERLDALVNQRGRHRPGAPRERGRRRAHLRRQPPGALLVHQNLLLALLRASAPARVVNVASAAQSPINFRDPMLRRGYDGMRAYSQSKLAQVMFTISLAERLRGSGVSANALHPASLMDTKMVRQTFGYAASPVGEGAEATVSLLVSPEVEGVTGRYFDGLREAPANLQAYDAGARERLWALSEEMCGRSLEPLRDDRD